MPRAGSRGEEAKPLPLSHHLCPEVVLPPGGTPFEVVGKSLSSLLHGLVGFPPLPLLLCFKTSKEGGRLPGNAQSEVQATVFLSFSTVFKVEDRVASRWKKLPLQPLPEFLPSFSASYKKVEKAGSPCRDTGKLKGDCGYRHPWRQSLPLQGSVFVVVV